MLVREEDFVLEQTFRKYGKKSCLCSSAGVGKSRGGRSSRKQLSRDHANQHRACAGPHCQQVYGEEWEPPLLSPPKDPRPLNNGELGWDRRLDKMTSRIRHYCLQ